MTYIPYDYWLIYSSAIKIRWPNYYSSLLQVGIIRYRYLIDIDLSLESDLHEEIVIFLSMVNTYCHISLLLVEMNMNNIGLEYHYIAVIMLLWNI